MADKTMMMATTIITSRNVKPRCCRPEKDFRGLRIQASVIAETRNLEPETFFVIPYSTVKVYGTKVTGITLASPARRTAEFNLIVVCPGFVSCKTIVAMTPESVPDGT